MTPETKIELLQQVLGDAKLAIVVDNEAVVVARHQDRSHRFSREAVDRHLSQLGHTSCNTKISNR